MAESVEQVTSFVLNHMKRVDMRPKEDFKKLDLVRISGGHITGRIMAFDADKRLAHVDSTIGLRWWYVKDLELEKQSHSKTQHLSQKPLGCAKTARPQRKPAQINQDFELLFEDFHKTLKSPYQYNVMSEINA